MQRPTTPADEHNKNMAFLRRRLSNISELLSAEYRVRNCALSTMKGLVYTEVDDIWGLYWASSGGVGDDGSVQFYSIARFTDDQLLDACMNLFLVVRDLKAVQKEFSTKYLAAEKHLDNFAESLEEP